MASLLDSLGSSLTPETLGALGSSLGLDPNLVNQGMNVVGPLLQSGAAEAAAAPGGADMLGGLLSQLPESMGSDPVGSITNMLSSGGGLGGLLGALGGLGGASGAGSASSAGSASGLGGLLGALGGGGASTGTPDIAGALLGSSAAGNPLAGLINAGFGSGIGAIGKTLKNALGFDVTPLLMAGLPMLLGMLKKSSKERNLDNAGIAQLLHSENEAFLNSGSPQAKMVKSVLDVGKQANALRGSFSAAEWAAVRNAPLAVAGLITNASGTGGTAAELAAAAKSVSDLGDAADAVSVVGMAFEQPYNQDDLAKVSAGTTHDAAIATIRAAVHLVAAKSPGDADSFNKMLLEVGKDVAEATKQGGFLGFGGKKISDSEAAALRDLEDAVKNS